MAQTLPYQVTVNGSYSCSLDDNGVSCWGANFSGQTDVPSLSSPTAVSAGTGHTCALDDTGVVCWGTNAQGQTSVPSLTNPTSVDAGYLHSCAVDDTGVVCWGYNSLGQTDVPSLANPTAVSAGVSHSCALDDTGVVCWGNNAQGQTTVPSLSNPVAVSAGGSHTCALDDSGVICWGSNSQGQTDVPALSNPTAVSAGQDHSCALDDTGVVCWGDDSDGQSTVAAMSNPVAVSAGVGHTCALGSGGVVCWGQNDWGQTDVPEGLVFQWLAAPRLDLDHNSYNEQPLLGTTTDGKSAVLAFDPSSGSRTGAVVYPGWFEPDLHLLIPDANNNGTDDIAVLGSTTDGKTAWMVHALAYAAQPQVQIQALAFPGWFTPTKLAWLEDGNANDAPELVVLGTTSDGKSVWQVNDAASRAQLAIKVLPGWYTGEQLAVTGDVNDNGSQELVVLGTTSDGKKAWLLYDSSSAVQLQARVFPGWFTPDELTVIDDLSGNGRQEIVVLGVTSDGKKAGFIHDSATAEQVNVWLFPGWFTPQRLVQIDDFTGNGVPELAVQGIKSDGRSAWQVMDGDAPGTVLGIQNLPVGFTPLSLNNRYHDMDGNGVLDLLLSGRQANGGGSMLLYDADTRALTSEVSVPGWFSLTP